MLTLKECQQIVNEHLSRLILPGKPENLYSPIRYMLEPDGKRIRPALVLLACNLFSEDISGAVNPAMAIEVFHNFTLMHDDIMDRAEMRRGRDTVHKRWNQNVAILSGDAMLIKAYELLSQCPSSVAPKIFSVFNKTAIEVCEGQQFDMDFESRTAVTLEEYLKMVELKTAVLVAASLKIGALAGGAGETDAELLYDFGRNLGIAFQLQDDLLDVYADPKVFGKRTGNDIVTNKKTVLLIQALNTVSGEIQKILIHWLSAVEFDPDEKVRAVRAIFDTLHLEEKTRGFILSYHSRAMENLEELRSRNRHCEELITFSASLLTRKK